MGLKFFFTYFVVLNSLISNQKSLIVNEKLTLSYKKKKKDKTINLFKWGICNEFRF